MKAIIDMKELEEGEVHYISLVDRAATRMPFRILKRNEENDMAGLDLTNPSRVFGVRKGDRQASTKGEISAVVIPIQKSDAATTAVREAVQKAGFLVDKVVTNKDGISLSYLQKDEPFKDAKLFRLSDSMVVAVKGFQPQHPALDDSDFGSTASANGFYQGVDSALDVLFQKICKANQDAEDEDEAAASIHTLIQGFDKYVIGLVQALPSAAFKADVAINCILSAARKAEAGMSVDGQSDKDADDKDGLDLLNMAKALKAPAGFTGTDDDWSQMGTFDKMQWALGSYVQKVDVSGNNAILTLDSIEKFFSQAGPPPGVAANDWGTMGTYDKMSWMLASYVQKSEVSKCEACNSMMGAAFRVKAEAHKGHTAKIDPTVAVAVKTEGVCTQCEAMKEATAGEKTEAHKSHTVKVDSPAQVEQTVAKVDSQVMDALNTLIAEVKGVATKVDGLETKVTKIETDQSAQKSVLDTVVLKTDAVSNKLKTTVVSAAPPADGEGQPGCQTVVQKNDADPRTGFFDTGRMARNYRAKLV